MCAVQVMEKLKPVIRNLADAPEYDEVVSSWEAVGERYATYQPPSQHWLHEYVKQLNRERVDPRAADHLRVVGSRVHIPALDDAPAARRRRIVDSAVTR